jgi:hypothetical protein
MSILQSLEEHLAIPLHLNLHQNPPVQLQHQISTVVWGRDMANNKDHHPESTNIHKFLPIQNTENPLASYYQLHRSLGENQPSASRRDQKKMAMD